MFVVNVVETSLCVYDFIVHIPELCEYLTKHSTDIKQKSRINCYNYSGKHPKTSEEQKPISKKNEGFDELDQILSSIEATYKDSSILKNYKNLLTKATEKLKSNQLTKDFSKTDSDDVSFFDLLTKLTSQPEKESEEKEESDDKKRKI